MVSRITNEQPDLVYLVAELVKLARPQQLFTSVWTSNTSVWCMTGKVLALPGVVGPSLITCLSTDGDACAKLWVYDPRTPDEEAVHMPI